MRARSFAVIPTRDRPAEFAVCIDAIRHQVDHVIAVCHGEQALNYAAEHDVARIAYLVEGRANISRMWNLGLNAAAELAGPMFDVAVLNDDAIPAANWFVTVRDQMHTADAIGASERRHPGSEKLAGWAFILDGASGLRADERFVHWFGDDDLQRQAGDRWLLVDGIVTPNTLANTTSRGGEVRAQIDRDAGEFTAKWGSL